MGLFSKILNKLGIKKDKTETVSTSTSSAKPAARSAATSSSVKAPAAGTSFSEKRAFQKKSGTSAMSEVDVVAKLEGLGAGKGLNWKSSIVDLLKLLDLDSSRESRNELATELGCPADLMSDSAKMNVWLHKTVLKKIAENGGNIPQDLLD